MKPKPLQKCISRPKKPREGGITIGSALNMSRDTAVLVLSGGHLEFCA